MPNRFAFVALAMACVAAAAGGGYLATRQNAVPAPAAAQTTGDSPAAAVPSTTPPARNTAAATTAAATPDRPVQETEGVVTDPKAKAAAKRAEPARPASAREPKATIARRETPLSQRPAGTLTSTWPSSAATQTQAQQMPPPPAQVVPALPTPQEPGAPRIDDRPAIHEPPARPAEPPKPTFEELVISADSVVGLQMESRITSETARVEDRVEARVTRDVRVGSRTAIPAGSRVIGSVTAVEKGGKFKEQAKLSVRFHTVVLADGTRLPITTETITRVGEAPGNGSAAKVGGGAAVGAIIGAIIGGGKGAAVGAAAGAGGGAASVQQGDRNAAVLQPGTPVTARILSPVTVTIERN
jgi:hypothetical protein